MSLISSTISMEGKDRIRSFEKSVFTYSNPLVGTGIALNADPTAISQTEMALIIDNVKTESIAGSGSNKTVRVESIRLICTAAGTAATKATVAFYLDSMNRYSSGGSELTGVNTTFGDGYANPTPVSKVYIGDLTAIAASSNVKKVHTQLIKSDTNAAPCFAVDDEFHFSTFNNMGGDNNFLDSAGVADNHFEFPYITIKPGGSLLMAPLFLNQSAAASFEIEVVLIEV